MLLKSSEICAFLFELREQLSPIDLLLDISQLFCSIKSDALRRIKRDAELSGDRRHGTYVATKLRMELLRRALPGRAPRSRR